MERAEPHELGALEARNHPQHAALLGISHLGLEADHVVQARRAIVLAQLHHRERALRAARIVRPTGRIGPNASVCGPRRAISSIGMQPSK